MELVKRLVIFANKLDAAHLGYLGDVVDDVSRDMVKVAQYVGAQGYWIRNERCWSNCYRQKRASKPSLSAQEVWFECQDEFQKSINNDGSKWDKYASDAGVVKTATYHQEQAKFAEFIDSTGTDVSSVIKDIINGESKTLAINAAGVLGDVAIRLSGVNEELAREASELSEDAIKEAAFDGVKNFFRGFGKGHGFKGNQAAGQIKGTLNSLNSAWSTAKKAVEEYNGVKQKLVGDIASLAKSPNQKVKQMSANLTRVLGTMKGIQINPQLQTQTDNVIRQLSNIVDGADLDFGAAEGANPPGSPVAGAPKPAAPGSPPADPGASEAAAAAQLPELPPENTTVSPPPGNAAITNNSIPSTPAGEQQALHWNSFTPEEQHSLLEKVKGNVGGAPNAAHTDFRQRATGDFYGANKKPVFDLIKIATGPSAPIAPSKPKKGKLQLVGDPRDPSSPPGDTSVDIVPAKSSVPPAAVVPPPTAVPPPIADAKPAGEVPTAVPPTAVPPASTPIADAKPAGDVPAAVPPKTAPTKTKLDYNTVSKSLTPEQKKMLDFEIQQMLKSRHSTDSAYASTKTKGKRSLFSLSNFSQGAI